jgi:hypothetical protein
MTKTEQALEDIEQGLRFEDGELTDAEQEALATLREAVTDGEKAKQDVIDESKRRAAIAESLGAHQVELENVKAEVQRCYGLLCGARCVYCGEIVSPEAQTQDIADETLRQHVLTCAKHPVHEWKSRAEKAEAELERARPLLEAVMGAKLFPAPTDGRTCIDSHEKIIRQALVYKEQHER